MTFKLNLSPEELLLLDGKASPEVQEEINRVKDACSLMEKHLITLSEAHFIVRVVQVARDKGRLTATPMSFDRCQATLQSGKMVTPSKATRKNPDRTPFRRPVSGHDLDRGAVVVQNRARFGISKDALERLREVFACELADVPAEVPEVITGHSPRFKRYNIYACNGCGHKGKKAIFKDGLKATCPNCGKHLNSFTLQSAFREFVVEPVA